MNSTAEDSIGEMPELNDMGKEVDKEGVAADNLERPCPFGEFAHINDEVKNDHEQGAYATANQHKTRCPYVFDAGA